MSAPMEPGVGARPDEKALNRNTIEKFTLRAKC
jgi:hypothetical protein